MSKHQPLDNAQYQSIIDFLDAMNLPCRNPESHNFWRRHAEASEDYGDWLGANCRTGADVQKKMRDGWPEGRDRMNELRSKISEIEVTPQDRRRRMVRRDMGDNLDIHAVYAGRLDVAWRVAKRTTSQGPQRIDICANMVCSGFEHADILFWRGAAAAVLTDLLESAGYMVRLVVGFGGSMNGEKTSCRIIVKDHGQPFDITSCSATIMPGFFRALGHAWISSHCKGRMSEGGISVGQGNIEPNEILISHSVRDHGTALAFVNETIAKINAGKSEAA